jgi:hypothetical protein
MTRFTLGVRLTEPGAAEGGGWGSAGARWNARGQGQPASTMQDTLLQLAGPMLSCRAAAMLDCHCFAQQRSMHDSAKHPGALSAPLPSTFLVPSTAGSSSTSFTLSGLARGGVAAARSKGGGGGALAGLVGPHVSAAVEAAEHLRPCCRWPLARATRCCANQATPA